MVAVIGGTIAGGVAVHLIEWPLLAAARLELARATQLAQGWQNVGERALVVAQIGRRVSARAARAAQIATGPGAP